MILEVYFSDALFYSFNNCYKYMQQFNSIHTHKLTVDLLYVLFAFGPQSWASKQN